MLRTLSTHVQKHSFLIRAYHCTSINAPCYAWSKSLPAHPCHKNLSGSSPYQNLSSMYAHMSVVWVHSICSKFRLTLGKFAYDIRRLSSWQAHSARIICYNLDAIVSNSMWNTDPALRFPDWEDCITPWVQRLETCASSVSSRQPLGESALDQLRVEGRTKDQRTPVSRGTKV